MRVRLLHKLGRWIGLFVAVYHCASRYRSAAVYLISTRYADQLSTSRKFFSPSVLSE